jgi:S-formylglutathione hydrolase
MERIERHASFGGWQEVWQHDSTVLDCSMRFGVYLPPQAAEVACPVLYWLSGLTCTEQNFIGKAGAQYAAAEHGIIVIAPDTSPHGEDVADDEAYDLGQGAGFYLNATRDPWAAHYRMYDYVVDELPALVAEAFPVNGRESISGHSMGGHGALVIALKNPGRYCSVSAFSPVVAPSRVPWGEKAFSAYLGDDREAWKAFDACELIAGASERLPLLIEQGEADGFLDEQLKPHLLREACDRAGHPYEIRMRPSYDHSYYFIATFIGAHIAQHAHALRAVGSK